jgi:O-antigen ligase/polysaccharide polymerase Wzy-like membrane protein
MRISATGRASARSSTTTSRVHNTDWPLAAIAGGIAAAIGFSDGGYFPTDWGWSSLALLWVAAIALFVRERAPLGRLELGMLAAFGGFIAWVALSSAWSTSLERSVLEAQRGLVYLAGLLMVFLVARGRSIVELLGAVCGAATLISTYALVNLFFPEHFQPPAGLFNRLSEPLGYPNALALVAVIGALLAVAFAAHAASLRKRALSAACFVVFTLTIFFTFSRGAWASLALGLVAMVLLDSRRFVLLRTAAAIVPVASVGVWLGSRADALTTPGGRPSEAVHQGHLLALATVLLCAASALATVAVRLASRRISLGRRASVAAVTAALVVLLGGSAAAVGHFSSRPRFGHADAAIAGTRHPALTQANTSLTLSLSGRVPLWRQAWHDWKSHWTLGSGAGTFEQDWLQHRRTSASVRDAHSLYLETLAELGPVGLALLLTALSLPLLAAAKVRSHPFVPAAFAAYLAYLIHAGGEWDWEMPAVTLMGLFCGAGLVLAARPAELRLLPRRGRAAALAVTLALVSVAFVGLIGNGALAASARAADAQGWRQSDSEARRAIRWLPWSSEAWRRLGLAQSEEGRLDAARSSLRKAIAKSPEEWRPWVGLMRLSTGRAQRRALREAARLNPRDPEVVQFLLAPGSLTQRWSYDDSWIGWPVAPLHRQHPIRSSFLDPRRGTLRTGGEAAYHSGIDISVRDDRPEPGAAPGRTHRVYAIEGGTALLHASRPSTPCQNRRVAIGHFQYWHVDTTGLVTNGEHIRPGQLIGWTCKGLWHVHLSEWMELYGRRVYVNPLHPGMKLRPYVDVKAPRIHAIEFYRPALPVWIAGARTVFPQAGQRFPEASTGQALLSGRVDVRAWIDEPAPYLGWLSDAPALVSPNQPDRIDLQVVGESDGRLVLARTVFRASAFLGDSRATQPVPISFHYAPGTKQALPAGLCLQAQPRDCSGVYWFRLFARPTGTYWDTTAIEDGDYRLRVKVWDAAGNVASGTAHVAIGNSPSG